MAQIPLVHNLHDEFVLYLSVVDTDNTMDEVCEMAATLSIGFDKNKRAEGALRVRGDRAVSTRYDRRPSRPWTDEQYRAVL